MRIVHVITRLILGGAQENTLLTVEGQQRLKDCKVKLVAGPPEGPEGDLLRRARANGVDLVLMPDLCRELSPWQDWKALRALRRMFREERPDVVHTHSSKAGVIGRLAARKEGVPAIVHTIHGLPFHAYQSKLAHAFYVWAERRAARWCDRILCVANAMTDQAVAAGVAPREMFKTVYSGMEVDPFVSDLGARGRVRRELGLGDDDIVVGKIARLYHLKGHEDVLRAGAGLAKEIPNLKFLFLHGGILKDQLAKLAEELGLGGRVVFGGIVDPARIPEMYEAMDLVVHASFREGLARVLPQALLSGVPVVSYDVDGAKEVVIPGETGWLVAPGDIEGLGRAMAEALRDLPRARDMALEGRRRFADQFRAETMVREITQVYREVLAAKQGAA
ncbi:MAG TPA: glycosyltransferase family 4 protein [Candidatus Brocadiia bacterium]|nr:glycosyltransferase family 4 protein [Candidatus Brocadiia bacterium]